jgi:hypothetical protein
MKVLSQPSVTWREIGRRSASIWQPKSHFVSLRFTVTYIYLADIKVSLFRENLLEDDSANQEEMGKVERPNGVESNVQEKEIREVPKTGSPTEPQVGD